MCIWSDIPAIQDYEMHYMNAWLKGCVFNLDLNKERVSEPRTLSGLEKIVPMLLVILSSSFVFMDTQNSWDKSGRLFVNMSLVAGTIVLPGSITCDTIKSSIWLKRWVGPYKPIYIYSGAKKYLVSHQLYKFSHLKIWERPVIFIIGIPQLWETK